MADLNQNQLIADLARDLTAKVAPQELPLFRANSEAYFNDPEKAIKGQASKDDILGFGIGEVAAFVTPSSLWENKISVETRYCDLIQTEVSGEGKLFC